MSPRPSRRRIRNAFTLIELIFVLALLAIAAAFVASSFGSFVRGRALNSEARRLLSLAQYAQSRAVSEGVPILLWIDAKNGRYGLSTAGNFGVEDDPHDIVYAVDETLTLETPAFDAVNVSEQDDEKLGLPEGLPVIRFNPDGFFDESSVRKVTIRQGAENALEVAQTANHLGYEIRPATNLE